MNLTRQDDERLRRILRQAYLDKEKLEVGDQWRDDVMRRIRGIEQIRPEPGFLVLFSEFAWRFAPVISLLILALTIFLIGSALPSGYGALEFITDGIEELTFIDLFTV
jgi:hypothetical protein